MLRLKFLIGIVALLLTTDVFASHYMGGEITWQCLPNGRFRFIMKLYRECNGINYGAIETINVANCPGLTSITMNLYPGGNPRDFDDGILDGKTDISPVCYLDSLIMCNPSPTSPGTGAVQEWYYTSDLTYPTGVLVSGVPPAQGFIFSHSSCCRNPSNNLVAPASSNWFLRAIMYPYQGQNTFPCYDNSPVFAEVPSTVICTGYLFTYNHNATDRELDSLAYEWAPALQSIGTPMGYIAGYSYNSPLPGPAQNPANIAATINPYTGEISYLSYTAGAFVTVTKVAAYRCGIKIAEIFREMQIILLNCPGPVNNQPQVAAPFYNPVSGLYDLYIDTVYAGDVVDFDITAIDMDFLPNGNPNTVFLETSSQDYGAGYSNPAAGCINPPCATLNPVPPMNAMVALATHFNWQTSCDHINFNQGCATIGNVHTFYFKIYDNACPAPAINGVTVSIVVLAPPLVEAPQIHCTEVLPNGDVVLTYNIPPDPRGVFDSYHVFSSSSPAGPFTEIDSIFVYTQNTYTHSGAGANTAPVYYYITTRSGCYGMFYPDETSDTASSIFLDVTPVGTGQVAELTWNPTHNPLLTSSTGWYRIYREFPAGTWTFVDSVQNLIYHDTVMVCNDQLNYRIEIDDTIGCTSVSNVDGAFLQDGTPPVTPVMDSVSVNLLSGKAEIAWFPSPSPDTRKYYVYRRPGGTGPWFLIDTVFGINNTYYMYMGSNPQISSESYCVAAVDSCNQTSSMSIDHRTLFIDPLAVDVCADKIMLSWNSYINMNPPVQGYRVYVSEDSGPYSLLADVPAPNTFYDHTNLTENAQYCYYVQGYNANDSVTSTSNTQCIIATKPHQPQYVFMRYATVVDNLYARIGFYIDTTAYITKLRIMRSTDGIDYYEIASIPPPPVGSTVIYEDLTAHVNAQSYFYKVIVVDSCNLDALTSNVARTIHLTGNSYVYLNNRLDWTPYEDRAPLVYNIQRQIDNYDQMHTSGSVMWGEIAYDDNVSQYTQTSGRFYYQIEASLYDIFMPGVAFSDTVYSNMIVLLQEPRVYIPNAFTPNGTNPIFAPVGVFTDNNDFIMVIYNRWGEKLFTTTDVNYGWDGYYQGKVVEMGSYAYYVKFRLPSGEYFEKRGSVMVVR